MRSHITKKGQVTTENHEFKSFREIKSKTIKNIDIWTSVLITMRVVESTILKSLNETDI